MNKVKYNLKAITFILKINKKLHPVIKKNSKDGGKLKIMQRKDWKLFIKYFPETQLCKEPF